MMRAERSRAGLTLVEVLLAFGLFIALFSGAWMVFGTGLRGFYRDAGHSSALQDALVILERLDSDVDQIMVPPELASRPLWISERGDAMRFYVPAEGEEERPLDEPVEGRNIDYTLTPVPGAADRFWPTRNGVPMQRLQVYGWTFRHSRMGSGPRGMQWLEVEIEAAGLFGRERFLIHRRVPLAAAAAAARWPQAYAFVGNWMRLIPRDAGGWPNPGASLWPSEEGKL